jgi:hypothetical protein
VILGSLERAWSYWEDRQVLAAVSAVKVCRRLAGGESLRAICRDEGMPACSAVRQWALDNREGFAAQYAQAREEQYLAIAAELLEIADDGRND